MEQSQHLFALESRARPAANRPPSAASGAGCVLLLQELVDAALLLLHPCARVGAFEQVVAASPAPERLRTASPPVYGSAVRREGSARR